MDGDSVTEEPSQPQNTSLTKLFIDAFPQYLVMGMTYDEYWHQTPSLARAYRKAYEIKIRNDEWSRWRQGAYIYDALLKVSPVMRAALSNNKVEPGKYPDEPWPLTEKEFMEQQERERQSRFMKMLSSMNAESSRNKILAKQESKREEVKTDADD